MMMVGEERMIGVDLDRRRLSYALLLVDGWAGRAGSRLEVIHLLTRSLRENGGSLQFRPPGQI